MRASINDTAGESQTKESNTVGFGKHQAVRERNCRSDTRRHPIERSLSLPAAGIMSQVQCVWSQEARSGRVSPPLPALQIPRPSADEILHERPASRLTKRCTLRSGAATMSIRCPHSVFRRASTLHAASPEFPHLPDPGVSSLCVGCLAPAPASPFLHPHATCSNHVELEIFRMIGFSPY